MAEKCCQCGRESENLAKCAGCSAVAYCNAKCQKENWKSHKTKCRCYRVTSLEGKGQGVVATRDIKPGEVVLSEKPVILIKKEAGAKASLHQQMDNLKEEARRTVKELHDPRPTEAEDAKIERIFENNGIDVCNGNAVGLYPAIARINHSCAPNVAWSWKKGDIEKKEVRALRRIPGGEEICVNYIESFSGISSKHDERQASLKKWNFICNCPVCSLSSHELQENDNTRKQIGLNHKLVPKYLERWDVTRALGAATTKLNLILSIKDEVWASVPAAYMEAYELFSIAQVMNKTSPDDHTKLKECLETAEKMSKLFGDKFVYEFEMKYKQVQEECVSIAKKNASNI